MKPSASPTDHGSLPDTTARGACKEPGPRLGLGGGRFQGEDRGGRTETARGKRGGRTQPGEHGRRPGPLGDARGHCWGEPGRRTGPPREHPAPQALGGQVQTTTAILDSEGGATSKGHCHCPGTSHQEPAAPASPGVLTTARGLASRSPSSLEAPTGRELAHPLSRG